jgi:hypothetical protein
VSLLVLIGFVIQFTMCGINITNQEICGTVCFWLTNKHNVKTALWQVSILWADFFVLFSLLDDVFNWIRHRTSIDRTIMSTEGYNYKLFQATVPPFSSWYFVCTLFTYTNFYLNTNRCVYSSWITNTVHGFLKFCWPRIVIYQYYRTNKMHSNPASS